MIDTYESLKQYEAKCKELIENEKNSAKVDNYPKSEGNLNLSRNTKFSQNSKTLTKFEEL